MKKASFLVALMILALSGVLIWGFLLSNTPLGLTAKDKVFATRLEQHLKSAGDKVKVTDVHPGDWTQACIVSQYTRVSSVASEALGIEKSSVEITNSHDALASDGLWGVAFIYPPNRVEYFQIPETKFFSGSGNCTSSEDAVFELRGAWKSEINILNLIGN